MKISNSTYDIIKNWVLPFLTGGATFILTCGELWHFPTDTVKAVAGTMTALATFISFVITSASKAYFKDKEIVDAGYNNKGTSLNG